MGTAGMTMTNAERHWVARVMLIISNVSDSRGEACFAPAGAVEGSIRNNAAEGVLHAAQNLIKAADRRDSSLTVSRPLLGRASELVE